MRVPTVNGRRMIGLVLLVALSAGVAGVATALAIVGAPDVVTGRAVTAVRVVSATENLTLKAADWNWRTIPGMSTTISVPSQTKALLILRFSAQSMCSGGSVATCGVRVLVDENETSPASKPGTGQFPIFDTNSAGDGSAGDSWEAHAIERVSSLLSPGVHTITVQWRVASNDLAQPASFLLDFMNLTIERVRI